jgi:23S rRNA (guanosine2251-2'-O)-methyltransferase
MQIEGRNPVLELLRTDKDVTALHIQHHINQDTKINAILKKAKKKDVRIYRRDRKALDKMSQTGNHQGVIAVYKRVETVNLDELIDNLRASDLPFRGVYIREAYHEHNIGAIIRSAEAAGFNAIIMPPKMNVTPQIVRASMGATEHINIYSESLFPLIKKFRSEGIKVVGIERADNSVIHTEADLTGDILLIIGGEDRELSTSVIEKIDQVVEIPMRGKVNSLNMSVAAALVIFEVSRQDNL